LEISRWAADLRHDVRWPGPSARQQFQNWWKSNLEGLCGARFGRMNDRGIRRAK
jgi:hypothetical protein